MGETLMQKSDRWDALFPLADLVTDLDPRHGYAYQVVGSNLAGLASRYDQADALLKKGMAAVPDRWSLPLTYASNKFLYQGDYAEAAAYARRAAEIGKRPSLALLAANLSALADTGEEYRAALAFLDWSITQAEQPELKDELRARRTKVETYPALSAVEKALAAFEQAEGRRPRALAELVPRFLPALPADPSGGRLLYDPAAGTVKSTVLGPRAPLRVTR
jgi:tetratricopeptide (TPR) repeat protein